MINLSDLQEQNSIQFISYLSILLISIQNQPEKLTRNSKNWQNPDLLRERDLETAMNAQSELV